ncbi:hypothetical protein [Cephaloticoccus capnophilus]|uniref:hypothetical protein n=1 Tax=Cephaloticoccus capnophilus TaxID=1548208 RepID=UPI0012E734E2|nr:hypothetical protein [Cephaloticoccus capnophilus]
MTESLSPPRKIKAATPLFLLSPAETQKPKTDAAPDGGSRRQGGKGRPAHVVKRLAE